MNTSTQLLRDELVRRGHVVHKVLRNLILVSIEGHRTALWLTRTALNTHVANHVTRSKTATVRLLARENVPVVDGATITDLADALAFAAERWPVAVKPANGGHGEGLTLNVTDVHRMRHAFHTARRFGSVRIERMVSGREARLLVVDGRCVAAIHKLAAHVTGDGRRSVRQLVADRDTARRNPAAHPVTLDPARMAHLRRQGYSPASIPANGEVVWLDDRPDFGHGGERHALPVHLDYQRVAEQAVAAVPGLGLCGVDLIAHDLTAPAVAGRHWVLELNSMPGIVAFHHPDQGEPINATGHIIDALEHRTVSEPPPAATTIPGSSTPPVVPE